MERVRDWHGLLDRDSSFGNSRAFGIDCGTTAIQVLAANPRRKKAIFVNNSDTTIFLFKGHPGSCALNAGMRLNAAGGSWEETPDVLGYFWRGPFSAITSAATKNLVVTEEM